MKFLIFLMAFFSMILAFIHICKRMGIDVIGILNRLGNKPATQTIVHPNQPLHKMFNNEYQWVALFMWRCLMAVQMRELDVPDTVEGIYCRNTVDRIRKYNGQWCFYYEVPLCALSSIRDGRLRTQRIEYEKMQDILSENLAEFMGEGFYYTGKVCVCPVGDNRIRIEVPSVGRNFQIDIGEIQI